MGPPHLLVNIITCDHKAMVIGVWQPTWLSQLSFEGPTVYPLDGFKNQYPMVIWIHYGTMGSKPMANGIVEQQTLPDYILTCYHCHKFESIVGSHPNMIRTFSSVVSCVCLQTAMPRSMCARENQKNNVCMFQSWRNWFQHVNAGNQTNSTSASTHRSTSFQFQLLFCQCL